MSEETVASGKICYEYSGHKNPLGLLERVLLESPAWHSAQRTLTWKLRYTEKENMVFRLEPVAHESDSEDDTFDYWATPNCMDSLPAREADQCSVNQKNRKGRSRSGNLREQVIHPQMWPTPAARDYKGQNSVVSMKRKISEGKLAHQNQLPNAVAMLGDVGQLNPVWVEWMMGYPEDWTSIKRGVNEA